MTNTPGVSSEAGTAYPSGVHEITPGLLVGSALPICFRFLCCSIMCLYVMSSVLWCPSLPPVVCRRVHVLFTLWVLCCDVRLYLQLFVEGFMSYLRYEFCVVMSVFTSSCLKEGSCLIYVMSSVLWCPSLPPVVCRRDNVLFTLWVLCCDVRLYLQLFVGGIMSYLRYEFCVVMSVFTSSCL